MRSNEKLPDYPLQEYLKTILFDSLVFVLLTTGVYFLLPQEYKNEGISKIALESLAVNSFFLTLWLNIALCGFVYGVFGPINLTNYEGGPKRRQDEWALFIRIYIAIRRFAYEKFFLNLNTFNISLGLGTVGVLIGMSFAVMSEGNCVSTLKGFIVAFFISMYLLFSMSLPYLISLMRVAYENNRLHLLFRGGIRLIALIFAFYMTSAGIENTVAVVKSAEKLANGESTTNNDFFFNLENLCQCEKDN